MRKDESRAQAIERIKAAYTSIKEHDTAAGVVFTVWMHALGQNYQAHPIPFDDMDEAGPFRDALACFLHMFLALELAE